MTISQLTLSIHASLFALCVCACSESPVNIGENNSGQSKTGLAAYAANWDGYIQAYKFPDGSDRVRLTVNEDGTGTIRFGNSELLPKPSDPKVKFPPNFPKCMDCLLQPADPATWDGHTPLPGVWDGFSFTLNAVHVNVDRLQATAAAKEIYKDWCQLQSSRHFLNNSVDSYSCATCNSWGADSTLSDLCVVPSDSSCPSLVGSSSIPSGTTTTSPCEREVLCTGSPSTGGEVEQTCYCDANGCGIGNPAQSIVLDAALSEAQDTVTGTLAFATKPYSTDATNYTIVLKRQ